MLQVTNTLALRRVKTRDGHNQGLLLRVGLEGGALLAVSAVRPSQLPAGLSHRVLFWPPNYCRLSSLWALPAQCPIILPFG